MFMGIAENLCVYARTKQLNSGLFSIQGSFQEVFAFVSKIANH